MAKSQTQQKDSGQSRADKAMPSPDASGLQVDALQELSMLADQSPQVSQLKGLSDMAQTTGEARSASTPTSPQPVQLAGKSQATKAGGDAGVSVSLQQELVLLEGELSFGSKALGFVGMDTSFAKLTEAVKRYSNAKTDGDKEAAKAEVLSLGNTWLSRHKDSQKKGDDKKRASIERIVKSLSQAERQVELGVSIDEDTIEADYKLFRDSASGTVSSVEDLYALFQKAKNTKDGIDGWRRTHPRPETPVDVQKAKTLTDMENTMRSLSLRMAFEPYFSASAVGIDLPSLAQGIFSVNSVSVVVTLAQGAARGLMSNVIVGPNGLLFDHFHLEFGGDLKLSDGFKIAGPSLEISSTGDSYSVSADGDLALSADGLGWIKDFRAGGKIKGGYDFSASEFLTPEIKGGYLKATLFDSIDVDVNTLSYQAGVFKAGNGRLNVKALGKEVAGTMTGLTYSRDEGVGLTGATITGTSDFMPVEGLTVTNPTLELEKTEKGWNLHGSGKLSVQMSGAQYNIKSLDADVTIDYSVHDKQTGFAVEKGTMDVTVFNSLKVDIKNLGYSSKTKKLTAASGGMSITMFGKQVNATMKGIDYTPGAGFDFEQAVFDSQSSMEPVRGFSVTNPGLELRKEEVGWSVHGEGALALATSGANYNIKSINGKLSLDYAVKDKKTDMAVEKGNMDVEFFNSLLVKIDNLGYSSASNELTAASGKISLDIYGTPVKAAMNEIAYNPDAGFDFKNAVFESPAALDPVPGFTVASPKLELRKEAGGWSVHGEGQLSIATSGANYNIKSIDSKLSLDYAVKDKKTAMAVEKGKMDVEFFNSLLVRIDDLGYSSSTGKLTAATGKMSLDVYGTTVKAAMNEIVYNPAAGFDFKEAVFESPSTLQPVPGFTVSSPKLELNKQPGGWAVHGSGKLSVQMSSSQYKITKIDADVSIDYAVNDGKTGFAVEKGTMDVTLFNSLNVTINDLGYASATQELTAATGTMSLDMFGTPVGAVMNQINYKPDAGFDFKDAVFASPGTFEPLPGFQFANPSLSLQKDEGGWKVGGEGSLLFDLGMGDAIRLNNTKAKLSLLYSPKDGKLEDLSMADGTIDLALYDLVSIAGSDINFDKSSNLLTIGSMKVTLNGASALGQSAISGEGKDIRVGKGVLDWNQITLDMKKDFSMGDFHFKPPSAVIVRKDDSLLVQVLNAEAGLSQGDWLNVAGSASIDWGPEATGGLPKITAASMDANAKGDIFGDMIPAFGGKLTFSTGFTVPFAAGPVPMEAGVSIGGKVSAPVGLKLHLSYSNDEVKAEGSAEASPSVGLYIKVGAGIGNSMVAYAGVYVKGELNATARASVGFQGTAKASTGYTFDSLQADYSLGADMTASLKGGAEVKLLYIFEKELYEIDLKSWPLGESKMEGKYDLIKRQSVEDSGTKVFDKLGDKTKSGDSVGISQPPNRVYSKSFMEAMRRLNRAIDEIELGGTDLPDGSAHKNIEQHRLKISASFQRIIDRNNQSFERLSNRYWGNFAKAKAYEDSHVLWLAEQNRKLTEAGKHWLPGVGWKTLIPHLQTPKWYEAKIAQGIVAHRKRLDRKTEQNVKLKGELDIVDRELKQSKAILASLGKILNPSGKLALDEVTSQIDDNKAKTETAINEAEAVPAMPPEVFDFPDSEVKV